MTDNVQSDTANTIDITTAKLERAMGGLNIALSVVLFVDGIFLAIMAFCCLLMSFSLFFMAAIPAFLVIGFLCLMAFGAAIANLVTGIGTLYASKKRGKILSLFPIITIAADVAVIPANIIALICGTYLLYTEVNFLSILIFIVATCAILLAVASLVLSVVRLIKREKQSVNQ
ncbi:MAG: hypothetical protein K2O04_01485 [Clostridiales bacterium]|nr:hypothetical protein [Clostridiales bacterium]